MISLMDETAADQHRASSTVAGAWTVEHQAATRASAAAIWAAWADVARWRDWNPDVQRAELAGPFADGSTIAMTLGDGTVIDLTLVDVAPASRFVDVADIDGLQVRTVHLVKPEASGGSRVTYQLQITGENAEQVGPEIGPQISGDFPETIAGLIGYAEAAEGGA